MKSFSALVGIVSVLIVMALFAFSVFSGSAFAINCDNDDVCEAGENPLWCPNDCAPSGYCGDGVCDINEQGNCPADCGASCTPTNGGTEICDGADNDCDDLIDEGLPLICKSTPTSLNLTIPSTASQAFNIIVANPNNDAVSVKWYDNSALAESDSTTYNFIANPDLVGAHTIKVVVNNTDNTSETAEKQWQLNITDANWVTFWGRVTNAETGSPAPSEKLSFYLDSKIESKYSDVEELESYTYSTWQSLAPKEPPDTVTNADGYFFTDLADGTYNYVIQGSREDEMEVKVSGSGSKKNSTVSQTKMIMPRAGYVKFYFESASAGLKSDLYLGSPDNILLVPNSTVGMSYVTSGTYANGTELKLYILVHGTSWGLGEYKHWSNDSTYAKVEQLDSDTWRVFFEDLPSNQADWDFNDVVALVDLIDLPNATIPADDCDGDGIPNWQDLNDSWCDIGDNSSAQTNFDADGHILYSGGNYAGTNNYTCGQSIRFLMFGNNSGSANETITFAVQNHAGNENSDAPMIKIGNLSNSADILTVAANSTEKKRFDWQIPCSPMPANGHYDIHISYNGDNLWRKIGDFYVVEDTTLPEINLGGITSVTTFTNQPVTIGYYAGDVLQTGTMPDVIMQIAGQVVGGVPDTSITVKVNKDVVNNPTGVDITAFGGESEVNLTYNQSGYYAANFTATDQSGNTAYRQVNISVFITEDEADAIALPFYTTYCLLNVSGELRYDRQEYIGKSNPDVDASFDMYSPPDLGGVDVGHEYVTPNDGLNETEYTALKAAESTCGVEYVKVINMTTTTGFCNELYDWFNWLDTSCTNICTLPPAKATVCGT